MSVLPRPLKRGLPDLNRAFAEARRRRGLTRKQMARIVALPARRIEKIERREAQVSLASLQALAALPEGKAAAAALFGLDYETPRELHDLLVRAALLIGGGT